jgi:hypothetical protein
MRRLIHRHQDYIQNDWSSILNAPRLSYLKLIEMVLASCVFWNTSARKKYIDPFRQSWACRQPYARMQSFLLSYVLMMSGAEKLEPLSAQLSLWSTTRAISTAMILAVFESLYSLMKIMPGRLLRQHLSSGLIGYLLLTGLMFVALSVTRAAFGRVCSTLFALAYITSEEAANPIRAESSMRWPNPWIDEFGGYIGADRTQNPAETSAPADAVGN